MSGPCHTILAWWPEFALFSGRGADDFKPLHLSRYPTDAQDNCRAGASGMMRTAQNLNSGILP